MYVNGKMISFITTPEMGEGGIKENDVLSELKYDIFDIL
jgi:hypothetical protein